jgi:Protein-glutamine gamma-glutamyltransferase
MRTKWLLMPLVMLIGLPRSTIAQNVNHTTEGAAIGNSLDERNRLRVATAVGGGERAARASPGEERRADRVLVQEGTLAANGVARQSRGIRIDGATAQQIQLAERSVWSRLRQLDLQQYAEATECGEEPAPHVSFRLKGDYVSCLAPDGDTTKLGEILRLDPQKDLDDLEREILLTMLLAPIEFQFPSYEEFVSAIRIRVNIVKAAQASRCRFSTAEAERPSQYWTYDLEKGFMLVPGQPLAEALQASLRPAEPSKKYTFSCSRAAEYVVLLGMAQEIMACNAGLGQRLSRQVQTRALKGDEFLKVFTRPVGSRNAPLPPKFFIPGDWVWFKNPDPVSAAAHGFEGCNTIYLGGDRFANFWKPEEQLTLSTKCLTVYFWRAATYRGDDGSLRVNERLVDDLLQETRYDPGGVERILKEMIQFQAPEGRFGGGAIEPHRDCPRPVHPETTDLVLPDIDLRNNVPVPATVGTETQELAHVAKK